MKSNIKKIQISIAGAISFLAIALGAMGSHMLKGKLNAYLLEIFETGVHYHLFISVVLIAIALSKYELVKSFFSIFIGVFLFSFSLYFYAITGFSKLGMVTPFGGVFMMIGFILLIIEARKEM